MVSDVIATWICQSQVERAAHELEISYNRSSVQGSHAESSALTVGALHLCTVPGRLRVTGAKVLVCE
jgi:hypothetical protein